VPLTDADYLHPSLLIGARLRLCCPRLFAIALAASLVVSTNASANAASYSAFGINDKDIGDWKAMTARISPCMVAKAAIPDEMHPPADAPLIARVATLQGQCRHELKMQHASLGVMRTEDLDLGMSCITIAMLGYDAHDVPACNLPSSLPKTRR